ncbi:YALI0D23771p [Yarrowia lipolytica CLIB122]|uniref:YALI0D23771p n=1 Tax=Yarrowia lipolytica (strain CLIB 122 / E 150) TaxID=284591 RepID=Q6C808_YARLI|nr:YALI0D23771p [Yarrowia lipolytica CLIB122]CAG81404.1 YALI0D23771p [Yarrowia lipolytica CLIB122]|eukprot:XP_503204.1 YALI0D23771p [Yarrowia lipolytica CLIB122]
MGIRGLTGYLRPLCVQRPPQSFADGAMFIDGHAMAHQVARMGNEGAMYDWRGVGLTMERVMNQWIQDGWNIEIVLFDGLTPREKMGIINKRVAERIRTATRSSSLNLAAACASVCQAVLVNKYPQINCKIAPGETDDILASMVWNYAINHTDTPTYLLTGDSDFFAFDFPENVTIVNPQMRHGMYSALNLTPQVRKKKGVLPSAAAYMIKENIRYSSVETNPRYLEFLASQMDTLKRNSISTHDEFANNEQMMHSYRVLGENSFDQAGHRIINGLVASNELYMMMPIMCEPSDSEFCFDAGRRWRSLAYEVIAQKAGGKGMYFSEYGRNGWNLGERKIPITDGSREQTDRLEDYKYGSRETITYEIKQWKTKKDIVNAIYNETALTTLSGDGILKYSPEITKQAALAYLNEIVDSVDKRRRDIYHRDRGRSMTPTSLRIYNKMLACVLSLRLLQCVGFKLPVELQLYDMDGARWGQVVLETHSPRHKPINVRKDSRSQKSADDLADQIGQMKIES